MEPQLKKRLTERMDATIEVFRRELASVRTGRATLALLDGITVDYYGDQTPLNQVATLTVPEPRLITIQPWEQRLIPEIEKAIMKSDLGLTPANDGKVIRLAIPPLTEERRKELVKVVKKRAEEARVALRNIRRDILEDIKKMQKEKSLSEDEIKRWNDEVQKITDSYIKKVDEMLAHKEKEIMEV
ncbi:MAG: ribosome recycling factor [Thermodesulfovibrionales bacterium]|nr:ribosome recycling factor [Thermodesulfovibrionales bacterium]